jgi:subtilisin family serine protease
MAEEGIKPPSVPAPPTTRILQQGKRQFIIAPRRGSQALSVGLRPMPAAAVRAAIGQLPGLEVVRVLRSRRAISSYSLVPDEASEVYVVRIEDDRAELVKQTLPPQLLLEEDAVLEYGTPAGRAFPAPTRLASWSFTGDLENRQIRFRVIGEGEKPLAHVGVSLAGEGFPHEGRTDKRGEVTLPLVTLPGKRARSLFASAVSGYWDQYLTDPELTDGDVNVVRLRPIAETITGFPDSFRYGWGQIQMGLDRVPDTLTGKGVRIAIIDSGVDTSHPLLRNIRTGVDLTNNADPQTWTNDAVGHGTHCAGIIASHDHSGKLLRGFVPEAEIHVVKVFPGGQFSSLVEALDYCLDLEIDLVNLSLGSVQRSQAIEQKLEEAALNGIACIVAGGNSAGPVLFPASSAFTLAVGAVGRLNEYPDDAWDATTVLPHLVAPDGIFSPSFTCAGPEVAVCAPGVAIVSTVPGGFEPQSGTSMAVPHVTGLAALLLAHHPAFQGPLRPRNQQRVAALFNTIRSLCVPYGFGPLRAGAGLPRLHGLERVLQPSPEPGRRATASLGSQPVTPAGVFGTATGGPLADPLYLQASLVAQAWPVQALLETLRRSYGSL